MRQRCRSLTSRLLLATALVGSAAACTNDKPSVSAGGSTKTDETVDSGSEPSTDDTDDTEATDSTESTPEDTSDDSQAPPSEGAIAWEEMSDGIDEAMFDVPLDYSDPSLGTISLRLVRHRATDESERIGSLLVNPGGPGFGGSFLAEQAEFIYGADVLDRFDIIGWDPRGTGLSEPAVDCIDEFDPYFGLDTVPNSTAEFDALVAGSEELAKECGDKNGDLLAHVSTPDSARDIDAIRQALGEAKISYFGFSYGSELGATWVTMFPDTVRAAVLDGAVDPNQEPQDSTLAQAKGFEGTLASFLKRCSGDEECPFFNGGDAEGAFDALMASINETPLVVSDDRTPVTIGVALTGTTQAMYSESFWPSLEQALADAQNGDGAGLLELYDTYYQRNPDGSYGNELEAFLSISCLDSPGPATVEEVEALRAKYVAEAPRFGDHFISGYTCVFWPVPEGEQVKVTGIGAGPVVVVGTTGDPATPLSSTEAMAAALEDGKLIVVEADQHTGYGLNDCINSAVDDYLVELKVPEEGLRCS